MCDSRTKIEAIQNVFITGFIVTGIVVLLISVGSCDNKKAQIEANKQIEIAKANASNVSQQKEIKIKVIQE